MPNQNAIVGLVGKINPQVEKLSPAEFLRKNPDGVSIEFEGDQTARLFPGDRAAGMLHILEQLRQMRAPVYVEVRPETREIIRLLIPLVTRVTAISEAQGDEVRVELQLSHAVHRLTTANPDFSQLLETLRSALEKKSWLIVTETDEHEIIDARPSLHEPRLPERLGGRVVGRSIASEIDLNRQGGEAIPEAPVDGVLGGPQISDRLAVLATGVELHPHHRAQGAAPSMAREDGDDGDARRANPSAGHGQGERKRAGSAHRPAAVPSGMHTLHRQDARETLELILIRRRPSEVIPDRRHRRPQLVHRRAPPHLPIQAALPTRK